MAEIGFKSDKGKKRSRNEDYFGVIKKEGTSPVCLIIADGMGGHKCGDIASRLAVKKSISLLEANENNTDEKTVYDIVSKIFDDSNSEIYSQAKCNPETDGMGTTLIVAVIIGKRLFVGHVGDSRLYILNSKSSIRCITTDHSYVEELIQSGTLKREDAVGHPNRNLITRAIGHSDTVEMDYYVRDLHKDDKIILCTDGLTNQLSEKEIIKILNSTNDMQQACERLIDHANEKGGGDNITVLVYKYESD